MKIGFLRIVLNGIQINQSRSQPVRSTAQSIPSTSGQSEARISEGTNEQPTLSSYNPEPPSLSPMDNPQPNTRLDSTSGPTSGPSSGPSSGPPGPSGHPGPRPSRSDAVIRMKVDDMSDREVNFLLKRRGNKIIPGDISQAREMAKEQRAKDKEEISKLSIREMKEKLQAANIDYRIVFYVFIICSLKIVFVSYGVIFMKQLNAMIYSLGCNWGSQDKIRLTLRKIIVT